MYVSGKITTVFCKLVEVLALGSSSANVSTTEKKRKGPRDATHCLICFPHLDRRPVRLIHKQLGIQLEFITDIEGEKNRNSWF